MAERVPTTCFVMTVTRAQWKHWWTLWRPLKKANNSDNQPAFFLSFFFFSFLASVDLTEFWLKMHKGQDCAGLKIIFQCLLGMHRDRRKQQVLQSEFVASLILQCDILCVCVCVTSIHRSSGSNERMLGFVFCNGRRMGKPVACRLWSLILLPPPPPPPFLQGLMWSPCWRVMPLNRFWATTTWACGLGNVWACTWTLAPPPRTTLGG